MNGRYAMYRLAQGLSVALPPTMAFRLADYLGDRHWRRQTADRELVQANLAAALRRPADEMRPLAREVFRHFGRYLVEFLSSHRRRMSYVSVEGREHLDEAARRGRGAILLSAHLGNWELAGVAVRRLGYPISAVALPHGSARVDGMFNRQRRRCGIDGIPLGPRAAGECLKALRQGQFVGLVGDRRFGSRGVTVSLFGKPVALPRGPCVLSARAKAPLIPVFLLREGPWKFRFCIETPLGPVRSAADEQEMRSVMQAYGSVLEREITRAPTQWLFFEPLSAPSVAAPHPGAGDILTAVR